MNFATQIRSQFLAGPLFVSVPPVVGRNDARFATFVRFLKTLRKKANILKADSSKNYAALSGFTGF